MRFFSDGPIIPDLLLERRDQGRVVFLCGAGVSLNSGMPSFYDLAKYVVDFFDPPEFSEIAVSFRPWIENFDGPRIPLDQIFHLLYQEYGRDDVNGLVEKCLRVDASNKYTCEEHKIIARISSDQEGSPQIVTTNFDHLFECGIEDVAFFEPPAFPDIALGMSLTGVTYLHGRLQSPDSVLHPYVLSSADFGRAYLSEGWATNFIRSLLDSYTVVLVGYQAEDPPVKYLLQGLNHDGLSDRSRLYAFDKGEPEEIEFKWRDRGVTPVAYEDHNKLWKTLGAWAERADDPRAWRLKVAELAKKGPRQMAAFERGQVTHLVRTTPGARLFASSDPAPTAEWLCVFDAYCRAAKKSSGYGDDAETFDPLEVYGLDDDPLRPSEAERTPDRIHDHILEWRRGDTNPNTLHRLSGRSPSGFEAIPPRLFYLSRWIANQIDSPIAAWWASRQNGLHPRLVSMIRNELRRRVGLCEEATRTWNLILEYQSDSRNFSWDGSWFDLADRIKKERWGSGVLREFEAVTSPILTCSRPYGVGESKPPFQSWEEINPDNVSIWNVKFPDRHGNELEIPDEVVVAVFGIAERNLHRAAGLLKEIKHTYFSTPTCYPDREVDGQDRDRDVNFSWFLKLFKRMVDDFPLIAKAKAIVWPIEEEYFFRKLKLFALNHSGLFDADEVAQTVLSLDQESFWDTNVRRELLFLLSDRWSNFSKVDRIFLGDRLLNGPDKMDRCSEEEYTRIRDEYACRYTKWLVLQGRELSAKQMARLDDMISRIPEWSDSWSVGFIEEYYGRCGIVGTDEAPDAIINLPVSEVVKHAQAQQEENAERFTELRPFSGLVKVKPRKALASLFHTARRGEYPQAFWDALIREWPDNTKPWLFRFFLNGLSRLPDATIRDVRYGVGHWLEKRFQAAFEFDEHLAWKVFDHLVSGLVSDGGVATGSGIGEMRRGGEIVQRSRRTLSHAINGPIGEATEGLIHTLGSLKLGEGHGIPEKFKGRFERLLDAPGEGGDHVVCILSSQINWLCYLDRKWVTSYMVPWFDFEHPSSEPAWHGFLSTGRLPCDAVGDKLKPGLLKLFPMIYKWHWDDNIARIATEIIVEISVFQESISYGLTSSEARSCLRNMSDASRQNAVFRLGQTGEREENGWSTHVVPFIDTVWPRERRFRTSALVSSWVFMLEKTGDDFPLVLGAVRRFLVPVEGDKHWLHRFSREVEGEELLTVIYPEAVLEILDAVIPNNVENVPYELAQILNLVEETNPSLVRDRRFLRLINLIEQT